MPNLSPYPFHLCQPNGAKSCGACCGLYNWQDHSRGTVNSLLRRRTSLFFRWERRLIFNATKNWPQFPTRIPNCWRQFITVNFWGSLTGTKKRSAAFFILPSIKELTCGETLFMGRNYAPGTSARATPI